MVKKPDKMHPKSVHEDIYRHGMRTLNRQKAPTAYDVIIYAFKSKTCMRSHLERPYGVLVHFTCVESSILFNNMFHGICAQYFGLLLQQFVIRFFFVC